MNVGLVIYGDLDIISGGYLYDRKLAEHLRRQGDRLEIVSLPWRSYHAHLGDNWDRGLLERLRWSDFDLMLQDELNHPSLFLINRDLRRTARYPIVTIVHHLRCNEQRPAWQNRFYRAIERRYLDSVDAFIFNSQTTRREVEQISAGRNRPSIVALPGGDQFSQQMSDKEIEQRAGTPGPLRVLFLGNLIPRKGLHILLEALARLPDEAAQLTVAGNLQADLAYTAAIQQQIARLGLQNRVHFTGVLPGEALAAEIRRQHVLAVPSSYEGYGIAYLEGMGAGLPAIGTTTGAASEIITHGRDGFLIPAGETGSLAGCLEILANDRRRLIEMSLAAYRRYLAQPGWEETAGQIRDFLISLVGAQTPDIPGRDTGVRLTKTGRASRQ